MNKVVAYDVGLLILRVVLGSIFIVHGSQKLFGAFGGSGMEGVVSLVKQLGFSPPQFWAWVLALTESLGGICLVLGLLPRISAAFIGIAMIVAIIKVQGPNGFFASKGGCEYQLLILGTCILFVLTGSGKLSLFNKF